MGCDIARSGGNSEYDEVGNSAGYCTIEATVYIDPFLTRIHDPIGGCLVSQEQALCKYIKCN